MNYIIGLANSKGKLFAAKVNIEGATIVYHDLEQAKQDLAQSKAENPSFEDFKIYKVVAEEIE